MVLFHDLDHIAQVRRSAGSPADRAELADVDRHMVVLLVSDRGAESATDLLLVPLPPRDRARVDHAGRLAVNPLVRERVRFVHVGAVDHARDVERLEMVQAGEAAPGAGSTMMAWSLSIAHAACGLQRSACQSLRPSGTMSSTGSLTRS